MNKINVFGFASVSRRIPLDSIPEDESECAAWLHKLYQEKVSGRTKGGILLVGVALALFI